MSHVFFATISPRRRQIRVRRCTTKPSGRLELHRYGFYTGCGKFVELMQLYSFILFLQAHRCYNATTCKPYSQSHLEALIFSFRIAIKVHKRASRIQRGRIGFRGAIDELSSRQRIYRILCCTRVHWEFFSCEFDDPKIFLGDKMKRFAKLSTILKKKVVFDIFGLGVAVCKPFAL